MKIKWKKERKISKKERKNTNELGLKERMKQEKFIKIKRKNERKKNDGLVWFGLFSFMAYQPL